MTSHAAAPQPISRKRTCWCRCVTWQRRAIHPRRKALSSQFNPRRIFLPQQRLKEMSTQTQRRYSLEEYFELERTSEERWEYFNGEVFCMSGVSRNHSELETNLITSLNTELRERGCHVYPANLRIKVPAAPPYRYPDLSVV